MVSIIIVHYHVKKELFLSIQSILQSTQKTKYEIIVVDNDEIRSLKRELKKKFPKVIYLPNSNKGFGQGNNTAAKVSTGDLLFFLNPDTKVYPQCIDSLATFLHKNRDTGIVAPLLYDEQERLYPQGAKELTPLSAVFSFSFIHKLFPNNPIARNYWMTDEWDRKTVKEVASIPGTAFMIRREIFEKVNGFDEKFFLYFEEHDLCKRVRQLGWKIVMLPKAKVFHALGASTKQSQNISTIFKESRFYYLRKHFGLLNALLAEIFLQTNKYTILLSGILLLGLFLLTQRIAELMIFIGDQGWFYLSARDLVTNGTFPLVGIASSHPWLHQGAFWTYMLAGALVLWQFHPLSGAYLSVLLGLSVILLTYWTGSQMFSRRVGVIAALLIATSPLFIMHMRMPYHTTPIPLFTLLFLFAIYKWLQGKPLYLPIIIFTLAVLYNFQISTFLLTIFFLMIVGFGLWKKKAWLLKSLTTRIILFSILGFIIPMLPMLIYDIGHGFPQTVLFIVWLGYKVATVFGYPSLHPEFPTTDIKTIIIFMAEYYKRLIYISDNLVAFTIAMFSFGFFLKSIFDSYHSKRHKTAEYLLGLLTLVCILGILITRTASEAYLPILFPTIILVTALFFDKLINVRQSLAAVVYLIIGLIVFMNMYALITNNYFVGKDGALANQIRAAKEIVKKADGKKYNLVGRGEGNQFESFTMNYEYLTWWLGNGPSKEKQMLQIVIESDASGITVYKKESTL